MFKEIFTHPCFLKYDSLCFVKWWHQQSVWCGKILWAFCETYIHYNMIPVQRLFDKIHFIECSFYCVHSWEIMVEGGHLKFSSRTFFTQFLENKSLKMSIISHHHILLLSNSTTCFSTQCHTARHRCEQCGEDRLHIVTLCGLHHWRINRWTMLLLILYQEGK